VTSGYRNDADGAFALFSDTTDYQNTAVGFNALSGDTTGINNIGIGYNGGENVTNGSYDIYIGSNGGALSESNTIRLGTDGLQLITFISGIDSTPLGGTPAQVFITNDGELGVVGSSARCKRDIRDMGSATDRLMQLHPVAFRYKTDHSQTQQYGLIAEEVAKIYPELVVRGSSG